MEKSGKILRVLNNSREMMREEAREREGESGPYSVFVQVIAEYLATCLSES